MAFNRPTSRHGVQGPPATVAEASPVRVDLPAGDAALLQGTGLYFFGYLLLHALEYGNLIGLAPFLKPLRIATLLAWGLTIAMLVRLGPAAVVRRRQGVLFVVLLAWVAASVVWAVVGSHVPSVFRYMLDYTGLFFVTTFLIDRASRVRQLAIVMALVILYTVAENLDALTSQAAAARLVRFAGSYFMGDGNDFAWAMVVLLPFPLYLVLGKNNILLRLVGCASVAAVVATVVLTQSRGGTLALSAALLYYWVFMAKRRALGAAVLVMLVLGAAAVAPSGYFNRMQTISSYEEDQSAQGRIRAWKAAIAMAIDYPLGVGAGNFSSAYGRYYRDDDLTGFGAMRWISAHSVYFKTLGEYGLGGLIVLLTILWTNFHDNTRVARLIRAAPERYPIGEQWPGLVNLGLVGYAVAGTFLGGLTYPHVFLLSGLTLSCRRIVEGDGPERVMPRVAQVASASPLTRLPLTQPRLTQPPRPGAVPRPVFRAPHRAGRGEAS